MDPITLLGRISFFLNGGLWPSSLNRGCNSGRSERRSTFKLPGSYRLRQVIRRSIESENQKAAAAAASAAAANQPQNAAAAGFENAASSAGRIIIPNLLQPVDNLIVASHFKEVVPVKKVVDGIKTADLLLKGIKTVHGVMILMEAQGGNLVSLGTPDGLLLGIKAIKVFTKGFKMSKKALFSASKQSNGSKTWFQKTFKDLSNGLKASFGAMNVVRSGRAILYEFASGRMVRLNWNLVMRGYEASKGVLNAVEGLTSLKVGFVAAFGKGFLSLKGAIGGVGVMVKAFAVSKEVYVFVIKGIGLSHGIREVVRVVSEKRKELATNTRIRDQPVVVFRTKRTFYSAQVKCSFGFQKRSAPAFGNSDLHEAFFGDFDSRAFVLSLQGMVTM